MPPAYAHLLLATGGSAHSLRAEAEARRLAKALGSRLTVLGVVPLAPAALDAGFQLHHERITQALEEAAERCQQDGLAPETRLETGTPGPIIVRVAQELECDLIVLGRRKLSLVAAAVLGSVSDYVVRHAPQSTLIVQPEPG